MTSKITCRHCGGVDFDPSRCCATARALASLDKVCTESNTKDIEILRLKTALEFYAEPDNHLQKFGQPFTAIPVWKDAGAIARAALGIE